MCIIYLLMMMIRGATEAAQVSSKIMEVLPIAKVVDMLGGSLSYVNILQGILKVLFMYVVIALGIGLMVLILSVEIMRKSTEGFILWLRVNEPGSSIFKKTYKRYLRACVRLGARLNLANHERFSVDEPPELYHEYNSV